MRLDRLEISGFKSFPDRADLAFDVGVTAIVGPNGCGKSNVVDAITWVLGEQSAKSLRGERMEDVIFSGSDARKATAAAEVRLRLSGLLTEAARRALVAQREGQPAEIVVVGPEPQQIELPAGEPRQVEIARRLYRSGESEYLIDGEVCRLRDVQDLLMDAGVGVKGYAVIEQGKIGQILSAKPTDRRQLIEEAAGVTKYKSRRRAAELKLEAAQQNLTRVDDIIFEIEKQRTALKRQAAKARRYKKLREQLRGWEKVLFARRYRVLAEQIEVGRVRLADARDREADAAARVVEAERQLADVRETLARVDDLLREARERVHARELDNERRDQQLAFNRQQVEQLSAAAVELQAEIAALEARREPALFELEARREAAARADAERDAAASRLAVEDENAARVQAAVEAFEHALDEVRGRLFASQNTVITLQYAIERAQDTRGRSSDVLVRLDAEATDLRIEGDRHRVAHDESARQLEAARAAIDAAVAARTAHEATLAAARAAREARLQELRARERDLSGFTARLESLQQLEAHREGYGDAARLLLGEAVREVPHHGSVADYLETDGAHERAVEALLGDLLQCIVVSRHDVAQAGLAFVRSRNAGRVGFLVLESAAPRPRFEEEAVPAGVVPIAAVLRVNGPYRDALLAALSDGWLAETSEGAARGSATLPGSVATIEGDVYRGGQLVFGGARAESRGILATKREIKELRERLEVERRTVDDLAGHLAVLEAHMAETGALVASAAEAVHEHEKVTVALALQVEREAVELERIARKHDQIANERRQAEEELRAADAREAEARESIARIEDERRGMEEQYGEAQQRLQGARDASADAARAAAEAKANHAALVERSAGVAADVGRLEDASRELEARAAQRAEEHRRARERRQQLDDAIVEGERQRIDDATALETLRLALRQVEEEAQAQQEHAQQFETAARASRTMLEDVRVEVTQLEVARATSESDLAHLASTCLDTLQATLDAVAAEVEVLEAEGHATPDAAMIYADEEAEAEEPADAVAEGAVEPAPTAAPAAQLAARAITAEEAIAELRAKIDRLGPVNMMAIEQFDELEQRHGFLSTQRQDLIDSIAATGEAIKRIDRTTRERFQEAFTAINRYFEETFTTLFGGGRAGLVLLDESDLLESGIDIIAQPPGKRLQSVQLLSGGEKALTAMALMFGIFKYRPSPFCLLDEIDAPLDDANIGRFIEMLRGMQDNTQFILVTHHRKTMEIADRLYGVTMEEPGVSKLISLKLH